MQSLEKVKAFVEVADKNILQNASWDRMSRKEYVDAVTVAYTTINYAHPFREGNGRSTRLFFDEATKDASFFLDREKITPEQWNYLSYLSGRDQKTGKFNFAAMGKAIDEITVDKDSSLNSNGILGGSLKEKTFRGKTPQERFNNIRENDSNRSSQRNNISPASKNSKDEGIDR